MLVGFSGIYANNLFYQQLCNVAIEAISYTCSTVQLFSLCSVYDNVLMFAFDDS